MSVSTKSVYDVIIAPVVSEKSYGQLDEGKYTFEVATDSNKLEIKQAIEKILTSRLLPSTPSTVRASASAPVSVGALARTPSVRL